MRIEAAMGQTGLLHQIGDADAVRALLAKPHRGFLHDPGVGFELVFLRIAHRRPIGCLKSYNNGNDKEKLHLFASRCSPVAVSGWRRLTSWHFGREYLPEQ